MTAKEALPHVTTWDISQVPFCLGFHRFLLCRQGKKEPTCACRFSTSSTSLSPDNLVFPLTRFDGADEILTAYVSPHPQKKTIIKWSIVVRRAVLVDSNLSVEKCQTAIKELYLFYGIEHFWNKFGEIIFFKELENIRKISNSLSQFSVIERLKTIFSISIRIRECSRKMLKICKSKGKEISNPRSFILLEINSVPRTEASRKEREISSPCEIRKRWPTYWRRCNKWRIPPT